MRYYKNFWGRSPECLDPPMKANDILKKERGGGAKTIEEKELNQYAE